MRDKIIKGAKIKVISGDYERHEDIHEILSVEWGWNDVVPASINTCCGLYRPTSSADGYWQKDQRLGGWELLLANKEEIK